MKCLTVIEQCNGSKEMEGEEWREVAREPSLLIPPVHACMVKVIVSESESDS